jgi:biopolymer transport protein ExbB
MISIFLEGGPVMWPLLALSLVALTVVFERLWFAVAEARRRDRDAVRAILSFAEAGDLDQAQRAGAKSRDFVARALSFGLLHREPSYSNALLQAAAGELHRFSRGLSVLDTTITLAPLLGLFGTVTGMIRAFGLLGTSELGAPMAITGGIAEALIATAFGLLIAIMALLPFNFLNTRLEQARHEIEIAAAHLERLLLRAGERPGFSQAADGRPRNAKSPANSRANADVTSSGPAPTK